MSIVTVVHNRHPAFAVWITGLPASGKSTVTAALVRQIKERGIDVAVLESDALRKMFSAEPGYDEKDREYFYGALAFIGAILTKHGIPVIFDATANRRSYRDRARQQILRFVEIFVDCPLDICIKRDPKGIYKKGKAGQATNVPGLQSIYEPPEKPDLVIQGDREDPEDAAGRIVAELERRGYTIPPQI
jgi:adenylylsulfate kinase